MKYRQLRPELQERVRLFVQYKWLASRGVNEESILQYLPTDLHREIQRHLCLALVRWVHTSTISSQDLIAFYFIKSQCFPKYKITIQFLSSFSAQVSRRNVSLLYP